MHEMLQWAWRAVGTLTGISLGTAAAVQYTSDEDPAHLWMVGVTLAVMTLALWFWWFLTRPKLNQGATQALADSPIAAGGDVSQVGVAEQSQIIAGGNGDASPRINAVNSTVTVGVEKTDHPPPVLEMFTNQVFAYVKVSNFGTLETFSVRLQGFAANGHVLTAFWHNSTTQTNKDLKRGEDDWLLVMQANTLPLPNILSPYQTPQEKVAQEKWFRYQKDNLVQVTVYGVGGPTFLELALGKHYVITVKVFSNSRDPVEAQFSYGVVPITYEFMIPYDEERMGQRTGAAQEDREARQRATLKSIADMEAKSPTEELS